jgi:serine/threonine protein kinase
MIVAAVQTTLEWRAAERRIGQTLNGKWALERLIDVGGTASVYEAAHRNGRRAAIKVLHAAAAANAEVRRRFLREGYVANKIAHPAALAILDDDIAEDGSPYLVMELLEGESMARRLTRVGGRLPFAETLGIAGQLLDVLDMAHANGVVHRDIKPGNIFITSAGHTKLLDFGFARVRDGIISAVPTLNGIVLGTPGYLAPEQARGQPDDVDVRTDLFGVGAVVFRAVTGRAIHEGPTPLEALMAAMKEPAPSLASILPAASAGLVSVVDRALAFDKADRWRSAHEMHAALSAVYASFRRRPVLSTGTGSEMLSHGPGADHPDSISVREDDEEAPSQVAEIAFGDGSRQAIERERQRMQEVAAAIPSKLRSEVDS